MFAQVWTVKSARTVGEIVGRVGSRMSYASLLGSNVHLKNRLFMWEKLHANCTPEDESTTKDCLTRQLSEGVHIRRCEEEVLNSKAEWHQPALWKVTSELCREWSNYGCSRAIKVCTVELNLDLGVANLTQQSYWNLSALIVFQFLAKRQIFIVLWN